jgi:hypothetical protein
MLHMELLSLLVNNYKTTMALLFYQAGYPQLEEDLECLRTPY